MLFRILIPWNEPTNLAKRICSNRSAGPSVRGIVVSLLLLRCTLLEVVATLVEPSLNILVLVMIASIAALLATIVVAVSSLLVSSLVIVTTVVVLSVHAL